MRKVFRFFIQVSFLIIVLLAVVSTAGAEVVTGINNAGVVLASFRSVGTFQGFLNKIRSRLDFFSFVYKLFTH